MGNILQMPRKTVEAPKVELPSGGAKILLFMGVRYERYEESPKLEIVNHTAVRSRRRRA